MKYLLSDNTWNQKEIAAIQRVIHSDRYTMGEEVKAYEESFAQKLDSKYAVMVNSGSSANLLAVAALVYSKKLKTEDEVIVPAVSWSTTYFPLMQMGLKIKFVDIDQNTLNMDVEQLKQAITPGKTKMILAVNLLGNANNYTEIQALCEVYDLVLMEDNCEALGGKYHSQYLGTIGLLGTYSTFYSHHLCTMEGGMVVTDDELLYHYMLCIRAHGWTRNLPENSPLYEKKKDPFYESFNFILPGFNLRPLEMEGALGTEQLLKMDAIIENRRENAKYFLKKMAAFDNLRCQKEVGESSWFGFAIVLENTLKDKRAVINKKLNQKGIDTRPIVAGNFVKNSAVRYLDYSIFGNLEHADDIHDHGFFIGNHSQINTDGIDYFCEVFKEILEKVR